MMDVFLLGLLEEGRIEDHLFLNARVHLERSADLDCELLLA
jgi:hypothetical protein